MDRLKSVMKNHAILSFFAALICSLALTAPASARDTLHEFNIAEALNSPEAADRLDPNIRLYFTGQNLPAVQRTYGDYGTNKKTNAFNKTDKFACEWAFLSAILSLQKRAASVGANAVIDIRSNYKNRLFESPTTFQCGAGNVIAGVALRGEMATVD